MTVALVMVVLAAAVTPKETCEALRKNAKYAPFFERVELEKLVQTISDATCKTFIIGENVKGKISLIGPENGNAPLDAEQFYAAFLAALDANGLTVTGAGRFLRIVDKPRAKGFAIPLVIDEGSKFPARDEMVTKVFTVQHADLEPLRALVQQFVSQGADVIPFPPDVLIVNELGSNLERLERLILAVDVEKKPAEQLRLVNVRFAEAQAVADEVSRVLSPKAPKPGETLSLTVDERSNRIVVLGTPGLFGRALELIGQLDLQLPNDGKAHVYRLRNAEAKEIAANLEAVVQGASKVKGAAPAGSTDVKISANESQNSLVIVASASDYRNLVELIEQLDTPQRQVFIETVVMEVNLDRSQELGVSAHTVLSPNGTPIAIGSQPAGAPSSLSLAGVAAASGLLFGAQGPVLTSLSSALGTTVSQFGLAVQAMQTSSDVNVLSTPHIMTTDNKEAEISVGQRIPFQSGVNPVLAQSLASSGNATAAAAAAATGTVTRERVELKLIVKPHISEGDNIRLEINQTAEELAGQNSLGPITSTRAQKTSIVARDAETVVLGGIMQDRVIESASKTPFLGDIPLLGHLFRYSKKQKIKVNLLVFLTPHIIREPADFQRVMLRKIDERKKVLELMYGGDQTVYPIDFSRKAGPLTSMMRAVRLAESRPENGGAGAPGEKVIEPKP